MPDPVPVFPERPPEMLSYRPVSGLAIAALVIAAGYAAVLAVMAVIAFSSGTPVFPGAATLLIPVVSFILAAVARRQIRVAEGTRSGLSLATWAWWLSILFGVGYGAVYGGTMLALWWQADADIQRYFFDKIRAGKVDEAFQFTIDPEERATLARREELMLRYGMALGGKKSPLAQFREHEIVQFIRHGGADTKIKSLGMKNWDYLEKGYLVHQVYRITTPEGVLDVGLGVRSQESLEFKGRRWQLLWNPTNTYVDSRHNTPYGDKIETWRLLAHRFGALWILNRQERVFADLFLDTRDPQERAGLKHQYALTQAATSLAAAGAVMAQGGQATAATRFLPLLDAKLSCQLFLPGFGEFPSADFVDAQEFEAPKSVKAIMLARVKDLFLQAGVVGLRPHDDAGILEFTETEPRRVRVNFNLELAIFEPTNPATPTYRGQAALVLESDGDPSNSQDLPQWRVVKLKLFAGGLQQSGPGAMSGR